MTLSKISFTLITLFFFFSISNAQNMVVEGNQWNVVVWPSFSPNVTSYSKLIGEDTTVNNVVYKKVYHSSDSLNTNWSFNERYLREDSNGKVYYKHWNSDEVVLYDFSLEVNDTFNVNEFCSLIVTHTDSIELNNGELRKRLRLEKLDAPFWGEQFWIEGIGSLFAVISHFQFCDTDYGDNLLCFYANGDLLYPEAPSSCFITGIEELNTTSNIKIYPNPMTNFLNIESEEIRLSEYEIFDLVGKKVLQGALNNETNQIEINTLSSGHYLMVLMGKDGYQYSQKLVKL